MERYLGLDAHGQGCTFGVSGSSGRRIRHEVVEANGAALVRYAKSLPGRKHLCLEEGTRSAWLYEIPSPHVEEIMVAGLHEKSPGPKDDVRDAFQRAEELRTNQVRTSVFKAPTETLGAAAGSRWGALDAGAGRRPGAEPPEGDVSQPWHPGAQ